MHLAAKLAHLGSLGFGRQRGAFAGVERFDLLGDGEVLLGDGPVGDALWWSRLLQLSECLLLRSPEDRFEGFAGGLFAAAVVGVVVGPVSAAGPLLNVIEDEELGVTLAAA